MNTPIAQFADELSPSCMAENYLKTIPNNYPFNFHSGIVQKVPALNEKLWALYEEYISYINDAAQQHLAIMEAQHDALVDEIRLEEQNLQTANNSVFEARQAMESAHAAQINADTAFDHYKMNVYPKPNAVATFAERHAAEVKLEELKQAAHNAAMHLADAMQHYNRELAQEKNPVAQRLATKQAQLADLQLAIRKFKGEEIEGAVGSLGL